MIFMIIFVMIFFQLNWAPDLVNWLPKVLHLYLTLIYSEFRKTTCPRLHDPTSDRGGEFTQPWPVGSRNGLRGIQQD